MTTVISWFKCYSTAILIWSKFIRLKFGMIHWKSHYLDVDTAKIFGTIPITYYSNILYIVCLKNDKPKQPAEPEKKEVAYFSSNFISNTGDPRNSRFQCSRISLIRGFWNIFSPRYFAVYFTNSRFFLSKKFTYLFMKRD